MSDQKTTPDNRITRQSVIRAAAWAAPAIAVAATAPLARASGAEVIISAQLGGGIQADPLVGTASGTLNPVLLLSGASGPWDTGELHCVVRLTGPWRTSNLVKYDGGAFVLNEIVTVDGTPWIIYRITADAAGVYELYMYSLTQRISSATGFLIPPTRFSGTFRVQDLTTPNPLGVSVAVSAANANLGNSVSAASFYPPRG